MSEITEAAMRGEMDYRETLKAGRTILARRPSMSGYFANVYSRLIRGTRELLEALQNTNIHAALYQRLHLFSARTITHMICIADSRLRTNWKSWRSRARSLAISSMRKPGQYVRALAKDED